MYKLEAGRVTRYRRPTDGKERSDKSFLTVPIGLFLLSSALFKMGGPESAILGGGALFAVYLVISFLSSTDHPQDALDLSVEFRKNGIHVRGSLDNVTQFQDRIPLHNIRAVSGYLQQGWILSRECGLLVETSGGEFYRMVLDLPRRKLETLIETLQSQLSGSEYTIGRFRTLQP